MSSFTFCQTATRHPCSANALVEYIRFLHYREGKSLRTISKITGLHRNTVTKALRESDPPKYHRTAPVKHPVLGPFIPVIDAWLEEDKTQPPKQRHTAKSIYDRLCEPPYNFTSGESTVRDYVRKQRKKTSEVFVPLEFGPGESAQCDWVEATVIINGIAQKLPMFCMRLCYSGDVFLRLYPNAQQEAFFDGICRVLEFFGGVPRELVFDNLKAAVQRKLVGRDREEKEAFVRLRTHYVFETRFCTPGKGNEKGMVENLVGYGRRNFLVPVPEATDIDELNNMLLNRARYEDTRPVANPATVNDQLGAIAVPVNDLSRYDALLSTGKEVVVWPISTKPSSPDI